VFGSGENHFHGKSFSHFTLFGKKEEENYFQRKMIFPHMTEIIFLSKVM